MTNILLLLMYIFLTQAIYVDHKAKGPKIEGPKHIKKHIPIQMYSHYKVNY